jgi:hypothetical protein
MLRVRARRGSSHTGSILEGSVVIGLSTPPSSLRNLGRMKTDFILSDSRFRRDKRSGVEEARAEVLGDLASEGKEAHVLRSVGYGRSCPAFFTGPARPRFGPGFAPSERELREPISCQCTKPILQFDHPSNNFDDRRSELSFDHRFERPGRNQYVGIRYVLRGSWQLQRCCCVCNYHNSFYFCVRSGMERRGLSCWYWVLD